MTLARAHILICIKSRLSVWVHWVAPGLSLQPRGDSFMGLAMRKFYSKEIPESPVYVAGHPLVFDVLETEDAALIAELDKCVARGVGGVMTITQEQFEVEVKKKSNGQLSNGSLRPKQQRQELSAMQLAGLRAVEGAGKVSQFARPQQPTANPHNRHGLPVSGNAPGPIPALPDPIEVPTPESFGPISKPPTAKAKDVQ